MVRFWTSNRFTLSELFFADNYPQINEDFLYLICIGKMEGTESFFFFFLAGVGVS